LFVFKHLTVFSFRAVSHAASPAGKAHVPAKRPSEAPIPRIIADISEIVKIFRLFSDLAELKRLGRRARPQRQSQAEFHASFSPVG
jgi:hypothetical protein